MIEILYYLKMLNLYLVFLILKNYIFSTIYYKNKIVFSENLFN